MNSTIRGQERIAQLDSGISRRDMLGHSQTFFALLAIPICLSGCQEKEPPPQKPAAVRFTFSETADFYKKLDKALHEKRLITLRFNGKDKIGENSRLLKEYVGQARNRPAFLKTIHELDTSSGREQLRIAFDDSLMNHKAATDEVANKSDNVVLPAVVVLIVVIAIISASTAVAMNNGPSKWHVRTGLVPPTFEILIEPV